MKRTGGVKEAEGALLPSETNSYLCAYLIQAAVLILALDHLLLWSLPMPTSALKSCVEKEGWVFCMLIRLHINIFQWKVYF